MRILRLVTTGLVLLVLASACAPAATPTAAPSAASPTAAAKPPAQTTSAPASTPAAPAKGGDYNFGIMMPLTGAAASIGAVFKNGADLAVEEINAKGGVGGMQLKPNMQDHKGTAQAGVEAMNQLVNIAKVPYVISNFSGPTLASQPIAAQNKILLVNVGGADVTLLNKPYLYNNQVTANGLVPPLAKFFWDEGYRKAAALSSNDAYGDGGRKTFKESWQKLGGTLVADELFDLNATDFTAQFTKIKAGSPDVVYVVALGDTLGQIVKQARAVGITVRMGVPLGGTDIVAIAGAAAAEGFVDIGIAVDPNTPDAKAKTFLEAYKTKYGAYPLWNAGTMYEGVYLVKDLIERVTSQGQDPRNGDNLLKALQAKPEFQNYLAGGTVKFIQDQSVARRLAIGEIKGGKPGVIKVVEP